MSRRARVRVDRKAVLGPVSRRLYGHFSEHLHRVVYGGMWAELLVNRKFELPGLHGRLEQVAPGWEPVGGAGVEHRRGTAELLALGRDAHHQQAVAFAGGASGGIRQRGLPLDAGCTYAFAAECSTRGATGPLRVRLQSAAGETLGEAEVELPPDAGRWHLVFPERGVVVEATLTAAATVDDGAVEIVAEPAAAAELHLHWVSLLPAGHLDGLHPGIVEAFRELPARVVKYPGGCFADSYDWRLGVGPRHERHGAPDHAWGTWEENDFGTDEFLRWCELTGTEPYLCANHGTGDPALAAAWVEYCNGPAQSEWGARRAANGRKAPWDVRLWAIGNEVYGSWERGAAGAERYGETVRRFAAAMSAVDPRLELVAQGDLGEFSERLLREAGDAFSYLSVHHYSGDASTPFADPEEHVAVGRAFEQRLGRLVEAIRTTPGAGHVRLALDEWGWADGRDLPGAAFTAAVLAACVRLAPYVAIGGHCCLVNPGGGVERIGERVTRNLLYDIFGLFDRAHRDEAVRAESDDEQLSVCAFADAEGTSAVLVNGSRQELAVAIAGMEPDSAVTWVRRDGVEHGEAAGGEVVLGPFEVASLGAPAVDLA
ncbi:MAG TPA: hypothetical protein VFJ77_00300 [Gaiellaceae bacterium]|nr:hypothetical protein [Gaiellaceae bacterium]